MKKFVFVCFVLLGQLASAQLIIKGLTPDKNSARISQTQEELPAVSLPFWDDFSYAEDVPDSLWEFSNSIYVNEALSIDPPTYKAATFDGLDALGRLYDATETFPGLTDQLVSRRILLGGFTGDQSLYLSFFWQAGGNGERPDGADSLRLQFLNADSVWVTEWKMRADAAGSFDTFTQEILNLAPEYLHDDFRFKFETFGSLQGPFDTWHVDYVYLDEGRSSNDLSYDDQSLTGSLSSLIAPFREMPAEHFFTDPSAYVTPQVIQFYNLKDEVGDALNINYVLLVLDNDDQILETKDFNDGSIPFLKSPLVQSDTLDSNTAMDSPGNDPVSISSIVPAPDSLRIEITLGANFTDEYPINDTIRSIHQFLNYYAYDDGEAEFAAGVRQNKGSIAVEYVIEAKDTLTHVDIYFPSIAPTSAGSSVNINIWRKLDGSDPIASKNYTILDTGRNIFQRVQLLEPVVVLDTIYVGFTQNTSEYVGVGVDRSNLSATDKVFYRISDTWQPNSLVNGVLMIRPVFARISELILGTNREISDFTFYPNPTSGLLTVSGKHSGIQVLSLDGKVLVEQTQKTRYDVGFLKTGIYLLRIMEGDKSNVFKLIKK